MRDRFRNFQLNDLPSQQTQRPTGISWRRFTQTFGDDLGLLFTVQGFRNRRFVALFSVKSLLKATRD